MKLWGFLLDIGRLVLGMSVLTSRLQEAQGTRTKELRTRFAAQAGLYLKETGDEGKEHEGSLLTLLSVPQASAPYYPQSLIKHMM